MNIRFNFRYNLKVLHINQVNGMRITLFLIFEHFNFMDSDLSHNLYVLFFKQPIPNFLGVLD